ncbi:MAG: TadE family protein [Pseudomonadota bacterium]
MQNCRKIFKSIICQESGVAAIEYAFILPVLLLLIFGMLETCMVFYASAVLTGGTITAARLAKTGYNNTGSTGTCAGVGQTRSQFITCIVQSKVSALLNPSLLQITSKSYSSFSNIGQPEPYTDLYGLGYYVATDPYTDINGNGQWDSDMGVAGLGGAGDIVVYKVSYPWHISTPMLQNIMSSNGTLTISASAVVKNEPYGTTTSR